MKIAIRLRYDERRRASSAFVSHLCKKNVALMCAALAQADIRANSADVRTVYVGIRQVCADVRMIYADIRQTRADIHTVHADTRSACADVRKVHADIRMNHSEIHFISS